MSLTIEQIECSILGKFNIGPLIVLDCSSRFGMGLVYFCQSLRMKGPHMQGDWSLVYCITFKK